MAEDKVLNCRDCGEQFTFTTGEQEFYAQKGFTNEPIRCAPCRKVKKSRQGYSSSSSGGGYGGGYGGAGYR